MTCKRIASVSTAIGIAAAACCRAPTEVPDHYYGLETDSSTYHAGSFGRVKVTNVTRSLLLHPAACPVELERIDLGEWVRLRRGVQVCGEHRRLGPGDTTIVGFRIPDDAPSGEYRAYVQYLTDHRGRQVSADELGSPTFKVVGG